MKEKRAIIKNIIIFILLLPVCAFLFMFSYLMGIEEWREFDPATVMDMELSTRLYDAAGEEYLCLSAKEHRLYTEIEDLPDHVKNAFVAIEDARFYEHNGIDIIRIGGALISDIKSGSLSQGASTISQQVVKNAALKFDKTLSRKLTEIMMAFKLEREFTKDEILEIYLNITYFGEGAYGIETAARTYFSKSASQLTLSEAAALAGTLKSPSAYSPTADLTKCRKRRNLVLREMCECGFISAKEYEETKKQALTITLSDDEGYPCGYYTDTVLDEACSILELGYTDVMSGGYKIYTCLDTELQEKLEAHAANDSSFPTNSGGTERSQCAIVVMDAQSGGISALIGGREHTTRLAFNRAVDMRRQPGSAIKPVLVFAPALEKGYTTTSFLLDQPVTYEDYSPRNAGSSFRGWLTLRDTVAYSVNIPAVKLLDELGTENCKGYASNVGIPFETTDYNLSLALGGFTTGVTPLELCSAYQPFANGGSYKEAYTIRYILDKDGNTVWSCDKEGKSVLSEESAFLMTSMLSSGVKYGTASELDIEGIDISAKTGTSTYDDATNNKDAWVVAYNPEYIICTWMGFDKTDSLHSLPQGVTGGTYPARLTARIFKYLYSDDDAPVFSPPEGIYEVQIDKKALNSEYVAALAGSATAASDRVTEYYTKDTVPREYASYILPIMPDDLAVSSDGSFPVITFSTREDMEYTLLRGAAELCSFSGNGMTARFEDADLKTDMAAYTLKVKAAESAMSSPAVLSSTVIYKRE